MRGVAMPSREVLQARQEVRYERTKPGWLLRGFWTCDACGKITSPIGDAPERKCCWCLAQLKEKDYTRPLNL